MITRRMDDKLEELKTYFNSKFNKQEEKLTKIFVLLMISQKRSRYKYKTKFQNDVKK